MATDAATSAERGSRAFGRRALLLRAGPVAWRFDLRTALVSGALVLCAVALGVLSLASGDVALSLDQVLAGLTGTGKKLMTTVVVEWRLPRVLAALVVGAALAVAGTIFQSLTCNPLASPDIIGFSTGSYTGALVTMILLGGNPGQTTVGALVGGLATAALVYPLANVRGVQGFRVVIVGIAISAMLTSVNTWLILRANLDMAMAAAAWGLGSLNAITWPQTATAAFVIAGLLVVLARFARPLRQLEFGDELATIAGVRVERNRLVLLSIGVALTATATAAAGPIAFIALAAPQIARRLTGASGPGIVPSACVGALLLLAADHVVGHVLPMALPAGVVTVVLGGLYLIWLLVARARP